jgi:hypothetical protein
MQELIDQLTQKAGLSPDQASKAISTIKDFVKDKFPMMAGAVDNLLGADAANTTTTATAAATTTTEQPAAAGGSFLDKISDFIPGSTGEKIEEFAKNAEHKIEDMFGGNKK